MAKTDPRVDSYIKNAAPFARPMITGAKSDDTRDRRLAQAVEWMAEGKSRNWKYER